MFSRKTLRKIWAHEIGLFGGQYKPGCTDHSLVKHPQEDYNSEVECPREPIVDNGATQEGIEGKVEDSKGPNFVLCIDPRKNAEKRVWFESVGYDNKD